MDVRISLPTTWNELSFSQVDNIAQQIHAYHEIIKDNAIAVERTSVRLYYQVTKEMLKGNSWRAVRKALNDVHPKEFVKHIKFVFDGVERTRFRPFVKIGGEKYHGPGPRLRNVTIGEFSFADAAFYNWTQTKKIIWLDVLCATLFREGCETPSDIDVRKPFLKQAVDSRADSFSKLSMKKKLGIATAYDGCRNHVANAFPLIFPKPVTVDGQSPPKPKKYVSFGEIVLEKIEGDPSKLDTTNQVLLYDFLSIINSDIKRIRKMKK